MRNPLAGLNLAALLSCSVLSGILLVACSRRDLPWSDSCWYHILAEQMSKRGGIHVFVGDQIMPPSPQPGYVSLLAGLYRVTGPRIHAGSLSSALTLCVTAFFMGKSVYRRFGVHCALTTCAIVAWCTPLRTVSASIMTDPLGCLLWSVLIARMMRFHGKEPPKEVGGLLMGCLCGLATLVRITNALLVPPVALFILLTSQRAVRSLCLFVMAGLPFLALFLAWNWIAFGHPLRTSYISYSGLYHSDHRLFSLLYALPRFQEEGIRNLLGHFLYVPYSLLSGGRVAGEGFLPVLLLVLPSAPYWCSWKRIRFFLPLGLCVVLNWALLSVYLYASERFLLPAFLSLIVLSQPGLKRLMDGLLSVPRIGPLLPAVLVLGLLAPAMERGTRESVSLRIKDHEQMELLQWIDRNMEKDAILVSGWQLLMERFARRTSITFWEALDENDFPCSLLLCGRPVYVQMDWYARNLWGDKVLERLQDFAESEEIEAPSCLFRKMCFVPKVDSGTVERGGALP